MGRPRDNQRQRLYNAERTIRRGREFASLAEVEAYVHDLLKQPWVIARWGERQIRVVKGIEGTRACAVGNNVIQMPSWSWHEKIVLHEVSHCLVEGEYAWREIAAHGPEFAATMRFLVKERMGHEASVELGNAYYDHRVEVDSRAVPRPDFARVRRARERKAERARKVAVEKKRPVRTTEAQQAAETLRRAIRLGDFGPSGSKARNGALAVVRTLEAKAAGR